jgi:sphingomyelin phosphodiesterase
MKGQFFGHTHSDHIETIKSTENGTPISTLFIAPSGTTYDYRNPSFRVYEMNASDNSIKDFAQYRLDLETANQ